MSTRPSFGFGLVQGHGGANESLQRLLVYLLALAEVDRTPRVPLETGVGGSLQDPTENFDAVD